MCVCVCCVDIQHYYLVCQDNFCTIVCVHGYYAAEVCMSVFLFNHCVHTLYLLPFLSTFVCTYNIIRKLLIIVMMAQQAQYSLLEDYRCNTHNRVLDL